MKRFCIALSLIVFPLFIGAQELTPMKKGKLWGYADEAENFVIQPEYTAVGSFMSAYAWVNKGGKVQYDEFVKGGKFGVINDKGEVLCPIEYDFVDLCSNDIVAVNKGGKFSEEGDFFEGGLWGYYDLVQKKEIVAPQYNQVSAFYNDGVAWVQKGGNMVYKLRLDIDKEKEKIKDKSYIFNVPRIYRLKSQFKKFNSSGKWAMIDRDGNLLSDFSYTTVGDVRNGMAYVYNNGYGAVNIKGELTVPCEYELLSDCNEGGVFWAYKVDDRENSQIGLIDSNNKHLTEFKFNKVFPFRNSVAWATVNGLYGIVDASGKELSEFKYKMRGPFSNGVAWVTDGQLFGFINDKGVEITPIKYSKTQSMFGDDSFIRFNLNGNDAKALGWVLGFPDGEEKSYTKEEVDATVKELQASAKANKEDFDIKDATIEALGMRYIWMDADGNICAYTNKMSYSIDNEIPEGLWDY